MLTEAYETTPEGSVTCKMCGFHFGWDRKGVITTITHHETHTPFIERFHHLWQPIVPPDPTLLGAIRGSFALYPYDPRPTGAINMSRFMAPNPSPVAMVSWRHFYSCAFAEKFPLKKKLAITVVGILRPHLPPEICDLILHILRIVLAMEKDFFSV